MDNLKLTNKVSGLLGNSLGTLRLTWRFLRISEPKNSEKNSHIWSVLSWNLFFRANKHLKRKFPALNSDSSSTKCFQIVHLFSPKEPVLGIFYAFLKSQDSWILMKNPKYCWANSKFRCVAVTRTILRILILTSRIFWGGFAEYKLILTRTCWGRTKNLFKKDRAQACSSVSVVSANRVCLQCRQPLFWLRFWIIRRL